MPRYRPKTKSSVHAKIRTEQRYGNGQDADIVAGRALHYGINRHQLEFGSPLRNFVEAKRSALNKKIRLLDGYVVVFSRSGRMITIYRLPDDLIPEFEKARHIQEENREKYRAMKRDGRRD